MKEQQKINNDVNDIEDIDIKLNENDNAIDYDSIIFDTDILNTNLIVYAIKKLEEKEIKVKGKKRSINPYIIEAKDEKGNKKRIYSSHAYCKALAKVLRDKNKPIRLQIKEIDGKYRIAPPE